MRNFTVALRQTGGKVSNFLRDYCFSDYHTSNFLLRKTQGAFRPIAYC